MIHEMIGSSIFSLVGNCRNYGRRLQTPWLISQKKVAARNFIKFPPKNYLGRVSTPKYRNLLYCPETLSDKQSHSVFVAAFELPSARDRQRHADIRFSNARFPTKVKHTAERCFGCPQDLRL